MDISDVLKCCFAVTETVWGSHCIAYDLPAVVTVYQKLANPPQDDIDDSSRVFFSTWYLNVPARGKIGSATCHCSWPFSVVDYIFSSPILFSSRCRWRVSFFAMAWLVFLQFLRTGLSVQHLPSYPAACSRRQVQKTNHELERYTECTPSRCRCNSWRHLGKLWVSNLSLAVANMSLAKLTNLRSRNIAFGEP